MNKVLLTGIIVCVIFIGCSSEDAVKEPSVDSQVLFQTRLDMEKWFVTVRFVKHICAEASRSISDAYALAELDEIAVVSVINHFNSPGGLIEGLNAHMQELRNEEARLAAVSDKDIRIFDNLRICNQLAGSYIELISTIPESRLVFQDKQDNIYNQLSSIERLLVVEYPMSTEELGVMISMENAAYRSYVHTIRDALAHAEKQEKPLEPAPPLPEATPTSSPVITWRDRDGFIHMGYNPPEGAEIIRTQTRTGEPVIVLPPVEVSEDSPVMMWVDENGITHMGHTVPDGYVGRPVREIPLMIGD